MSDPAQNRRVRVAALVIGFLARDPYAREALPREVWTDLFRIARRVAPDLVTRGLGDDVVTEAFRLLLSRPAGHYDPDRGDAWGYLREMVRLAARDVRERESPAGMPGLARRGAWGETEHALLPVPLDAEQVAGDVVEDFEDRVLGAIVVASFIDAVPAEAPVWLSAALSLAVEGLSVTETAEALQVSRFQLRRALNRWAQPLADLLH
jgi:DNA-directed RNA polymerase specialized sigma24 family protein